MFKLDKSNETISNNFVLVDLMHLLATSKRFPLRLIKVPVRGWRRLALAMEIGKETGESVRLMVY